MADTQFPRKMFKGDTGFPLGTLEIEVEVSDKTDGDKVCVRSVEGKPFSYPPEFRHPFDTVLQSDIYWSAYKWVRPDQLHDLPADLQLTIDNASRDVPSGWLEEAEALSDEYAAEAQERADLYSIGMGR
jgi:hypothetical protein